MPWMAKLSLLTKRIPFSSTNFLFCLIHSHPSLWGIWPIWPIWPGRLCDLGTWPMAEKDFTPKKRDITFTNTSDSKPSKVLCYGVLAVATPGDSALLYNSPWPILWQLRCRMVIAPNWDWSVGDFQAAGTVTSWWFEPVGTCSTFSSHETANEDQIALFWRKQSILLTRINGRFQ